MLEIEFLRHFDFPEQYITTLQKAFGKHFLPLQEMGINKGKLFEGTNLLVQAPTSSGKTMLAELLFLHHARSPKSTLLLVPTKALANQRYRELKTRYEPLGFKICLSTRDHPHHDADIRKGDFHLAVLVYEKLLSLLVDSSPLLSYTGACVFDELHYLHDPKRGMDIDLLLTRIKQETHIQLLGLSAIPLDDSVCEWLGMKRLQLEERPVELRQGVLCRGKFHYRECNSHQCGMEELPLEETTDDGKAMLEAARHFYRQNESTLVFFPTRQLCYTAARKFTDSLDNQDTIEPDGLSGLEDTSVKRFLSQLLPKRIAVHTSDLTTNERGLVESLIQNNQVRVIFATNTLAEGINFPVTNVITTKHTYAASSHSSAVQPAPVKKPLPFDRLQNMTGRAGRYGIEDHGRGIIVTCYPGEVDGLLRQYFPPQHKQPPTRNTVSEFQSVLLKIQALFSPRNAEAFCHCIQQTYRQRTFGQTPSNIQILDSPSIATHIHNLLQHHFLDEQFSELHLTCLGRIAVLQGLSLESAKELISLSKNMNERDDLDAAGFLIHLTMLPEMVEHYIPLSPAEIKTKAWLGALRTWIKNNGHHSAWLDDRTGSPETLTPLHHTACKKTMLCLEWMNGVSIMELEERYGVYSGFIKRFTSDCAWMVNAFMNMLAVIAAESKWIDEVSHMRDQLLYGLPKPTLKWCDYLQTEQLNRSQVLTLVECGFEHPKQIKKQDQEFLLTVLSADIVEMLEKSSQEKYAHNPSTEKTIRLDASRPDQIIIAGKPVRFTPMQTSLLHYLADHVNQCVEYAKIMNRLWGEGFGDRKSLNRLKNQIVQKCEQTGGMLYKDLIDVVPGIGLILKTKVIR